MKRQKSEDSFEEWLIKNRRWFHKRPEVGLKEIQTTNRVVELLQKFGLEVTTFNDITGAVGLLKCGGGPGPCLGYRADIDALPIKELVNTSYSSLNKGYMHACGHDIHLTILLGLIKYIIDSGLSKQLKGSIKFIFQPAEETVGGAKSLIERGVLENPSVDRILAAHVDPGLQTGQIGIQRTIGFAQSKAFTLTITGSGGHGAQPQYTKDPIVAGAYVVSTIQSILGRNLDPIDSAVISVTSFQSGGGGTNIIPDEANLKGIIRVLTPETGKLIETRLEDLAKGLSTAFEVNVNLRFKKPFPATVNDPVVSDFMYETGTDIFGKENVSYIPPQMVTEDFSYFAQKKPSCMVRLGCGFPGPNEPLHSPRFYPDEKVLDIGVSLFVEATKRYLYDG